MTISVNTLVTLTIEYRVSIIHIIFYSIAGILRARRMSDVYGAVKVGKLKLKGEKKHKKHKKSKKRHRDEDGNDDERKKAKTSITREDIDKHGDHLTEAYFWPCRY